MFHEPTYTTSHQHTHTHTLLAKQMPARFPFAEKRFYTLNNVYLINRIVSIEI